MSRPTPPTVDSGTVSWDADVNDALEFIFDKPCPLFFYDDNLSALETAHPADENDQCVCICDDDDAGYVVVISDGVAWRVIGRQAADPIDLSGTTGGSSGSLTNVQDPADSPASADALRDDLVANTLPDIRDNFEALKLKLNDLLAKLRATGVISDG